MRRSSTGGPKDFEFQDLLLGFMRWSRVAPRILQSLLSGMKASAVEETVPTRD